MVNKHNLKKPRNLVHISYGIYYASKPETSRIKGMLSSGTLRRVALVKTEVSEEKSPPSSG
jgi:hypothetical protein